MSEIQAKDTILQELQVQISEKHAVAFVGAGISVAAGDDTSIASWDGLLKSGVKRCEAVVPNLPDRWAERLREEIASTDKDDLLSAAYKITSKLKERQEYGLWLQKTIGNLHVEKPAIIEALRDLQIPILTTNYDDLIEQVTGWQPVLWRQSQAVESILRGDTPGVVHLHGHWRDPDSVILGVDDYDSILHHTPIQALLRALQSMRTLLFIGFGAGLRDPNFGTLFRWARNTFPSTQYRHYRFAREQDVSAIQAEHESDHIHVMSYGKQYSDLPAFLQTIAPSKPSNPDLGEKPTYRHNLPYPDDLFLGREKELKQIDDWIVENRFRIIALTGRGGIGKSSLAIQVGLRSSQRFDAVIYSSAKDLVGRRLLALDDVIGHIDTVLNLGGSLTRLPTSKKRRHQAKTLLNAGRYLLVLDNLEVLAKSDVKKLDRFLKGIVPRSGTIALLTLRPQELDPLIDPNRPNRYDMVLDGLKLGDAVALLGKLINTRGDAVWEKIPSHLTLPTDLDHDAVSAGIDDVPADKVGAIVALAKAAHNYPKLLYFAAAAIESPDNGWDDVLMRFQRLQGDDYQQQVEDIIGEMFIDLTRRKPEARALMQSTLLFSGGASLDALRFVFCGRSVEPESDEATTFNDARRTAIRASLLDVKDSKLGNLGRSVRYETHPLVRQYLEKHPPGKEQHGHWGNAHTEFFFEFAQVNERNYPNLDRERLNLFAAIVWAGTHNAYDLIVGFARHLFWFNLVFGTWREAKEQLGAGAETARKIDDRSGEAWLRYYLGVLCRYQGDHVQALKSLAKSMRLGKELKDNLLMSGILREAGILRRHRGKPQQALRCYDVSLRLAEELGDVTATGWTPHEKGVALSFIGRDKDASKCFEESLQLAEALQDGQLRANSLLHMGIVNWKEREFDKALHYCNESLTLAIALGEKAVQGRAKNQIGVILGYQGKFEEARRYIAESMAIKEQIGDRTGMVVSLYYKGEIELTEAELLDDPEVGAAKIDDAEKWHRESLETANEYWRAWNYYGLARCAEARGKYSDALQLVGLARASAEKLPIPDLAVVVQAMLQRLEHADKRIVPQLAQEEAPD